LHKLQELVRDIDVAMMTTVTPDGALHSRPMVTLHFGEEGEMWFYTSQESDKVHDVESENAVNLSYADPRKERYVSITGNASVVHDPERVKELWTPRAKKYFPKGADDPQLALLRVRVETAEYWDSPGGESASLIHAGRHAHGGPEAKEAGGAEHTKVDIRATPTSG